jgi:hypothetical protein
MDMVYVLPVLVEPPSDYMTQKLSILVSCFPKLRVLHMATLQHSSDSLLQWLPYFHTLEVLEMYHGEFSTPIIHRERNLVIFLPQLHTLIIEDDEDGDVMNYPCGICLP